MAAGMVIMRDAVDIDACSLQVAMQRRRQPNGQKEPGGNPGWAGHGPGNSPRAPIESSERRPPAMTVWTPRGHGGTPVAPMDRQRVDKVLLVPPGANPPVRHHLKVPPAGTSTERTCVP